MTVLYNVIKGGEQMKTNDVLKTGIDRNFLRKCVEEGIIVPLMNDSDTIIHKEYIPKEYSQEDVEAVWNAYLYRKMGLSYDQIKTLRQGGEISLRSSLDNLIKKYVDEIEELKALVEFMRLAKIIGFIPDPPTEFMGSKKFSGYLSDFMNYIDGDCKIRASMPVIEFFSEVDNFEEISEEELSKQASAAYSIYPHWTEDDVTSYAEAFIALSEKTDEDPANEDVQSIIGDIFTYQKKLKQDPSMTKWSFAIGILEMSVYDSDLSVFYKKMLGEETFKYFISALIEFLKINEPEKVKERFGEYEVESNE